MLDDEKMNSRVYLEEDEVDQFDKDFRPPKPKQVITRFQGLYLNSHWMVCLLQTIVKIIQINLLHTSSHLKRQIDDDLLQLRSHNQH